MNTSMETSNFSGLRASPPIAPGAGSARGFTLIELLVTVTIIAVLLALLLPVVGIVRDSARTVACQTNQRGFGMAILAWARDRGGRLPYGQGAPNSDVYYNWMGAIKEVEPTTIFTCPGARLRSGWRHYTANIQPLTDRNFPTTALNYLRKQVRIAEVRSGLVMVFDGGQESDGNARPVSERLGFTFWYSDNPAQAATNDMPVPPAVTDAFGIDRRHSSSKRTNFLFADGHSRTVEIQNFTRGDFRILSNGRKYY